MKLTINGPLPDTSAPRFIAAMEDTHVAGLIEHCVEKLVWKRTMLGFLAGAAVGVILCLLIH
jgi:hypothetical protein